ncbi:NAD(P)-binding protein [Clathrospora elynae]|uniref:NAD(P)-binding protein n=1 Tax=Clathrospora elynae TaxID=706981 RepID=A0A6A5SKC1_9PLEO|nr:NAD(P)-binding protein [Clathrospora elynae]
MSYLNVGSCPSSGTATPSSPVSSIPSGYSTPASETNEPQPLNLSSSNPRRLQQVLVVGGLGYIGSHTSLELLRAGFNVVIVDNLDNSYLTSLDRIKTLRDAHYWGNSWSPSINFYEADYRDEQAMSAILGRYGAGPSGSSIQGVIHFAAHKAVSESIQKPLMYYANNVAGMVTFCSLLDTFNIKTLIFSSSAAVYGEVTPDTGRISENHCLHETREWVDHSGIKRVTQGGCTAISNPYGRSKWMCEAILNDLATSDPEWSIVALRYFNPIGCDASGKLGEDPRTEPSNLMPSLLLVMNGRMPHLKIFGTDWETRDGTAMREQEGLSRQRRLVAELETWALWWRIPRGQLLNWSGRQRGQFRIVVRICVAFSRSIRPAGSVQGT